MDGYTLLNLEDVEDAAPGFGMAPALEARFAREALALERSGLSFQRLAPDARLPFGHVHGAQEEVYVIVAGSGRAAIDDAVVELRAWDALRVAPQIMRCLEAGGEGMSFLVFGAPFTGPGDAEITPGWWPE